MSALLPVITAVVADKAERGYLAMVAHTREVVDLPLETAPIDTSPHALEIRVEGDADGEPLVVMAEAVGAPGAKGFPLRLYPLDDQNAQALANGLFGSKKKAPAAVSNTQDDNSIDISITMPGVSALKPATSPGLKPATLTDVKRSLNLPEVSADHAAALTRSTNSSSTRARAPGALRGRVLGDGRFRLDDLLGGGASGEVYRATHTSLRRKVAVKVLHPALQYDPDYCRRFYGEALAASGLDHVNILRVLDYGQEPDGLLFLAMELLEGKNLQQILEHDGPLPTDRIARLIMQACAGLARAHDAGLVHRDIKPENIVVVIRRDDDGQEKQVVKVCDFGIAHWEAPASPTEIGDEDRTLVKRPDDSKVVGTPLYMAPEQIKNDAIDARTDVYALGVVLYELATGRVPFLSEKPYQVLMRHLHEQPVPPSKYKRDMDPDFEDIVLRALSKDPNNRQNDARVLRKELKELLEEAQTFPSGMMPLVAVPIPITPIPSVAVLRDADEHNRIEKLPSVAAALKKAIMNGDAAAARELVTWLQGRLAGGAASAEKEIELVERALHALRDPAAITSFVTRCLVNTAGAGIDTDAAFIFRAAGPVAARALVEARASRPATPEIRARFIGLLRASGPSALPVIIEALGPLTALATRQDELLAEDLLQGMPEAASDVGGETTVRFVRPDKPALAGRALRVTAALWGRRAQSLLLGVLDSPIEGLKVIAIEMLERGGMIDAWAIDRLVRIVSQPTIPEALRVRAAAAFGLATPESRAGAMAFLAQRLDQSNDVVSSVLQALGSGDPPNVIIALARAYITLDLAHARPYIMRLAGARADLRPTLEKLLSR